MPASYTGTFTTFPALRFALPPLVRQQRGYARRIAAVASAVTKEKATRAKIDALLIAAGLKKSDVVTCGGYDVRHHERDGQTSLNEEQLVAGLVILGLEEKLVRALVAECTETGEVATFATVTPTKGATVRVS